MYPVIASIPEYCTQICTAFPLNTMLPLLWDKEANLKSTWGGVEVGQGKKHSGFVEDRKADFR